MYMSVCHPTFVVVYAIAKSDLYACSTKRRFNWLILLAAIASSSGVTPTLSLAIVCYKLYRNDAPFLAYVLTTIGVRI